MFAIFDWFTNSFARPVYLGLAWVYGIVVLGTVIAQILSLFKGGDSVKNLQQRMYSWWIMVTIFVLALLFGWQGVTLTFAAVSFLGLREFLSLVPRRLEDRYVIPFTYLTIPVAYGLVAAHKYGIYLVSIPVWFFLCTPFLTALSGQTRGYLATVATFNWGAMVCVHNVGYMAFLMRVPDSPSLPGGPAGLVFFILFVTESNDVLQYCFGKLFGRRKIIPKVSPNKTWAGFLGGWAGTATLIAWLGPSFVPLPPWPLRLLALCLPVIGFAGDASMAAIKRDMGVKDTSALIPGHGGVLDRINSLAFTCPAFFHVLVYYGLQV